jgi:hypothetical protein
MTNEVVKAVLKSLDEKKIVAEILEKTLEPALKKFVADSSNPYDDMLFTMGYPKLKEFMLEELDKFVVKLEQ